MPKDLKLSKSETIIAENLLRKREAGVAKRLATLVLDDPEAWAWGGEGILRDGVPVGEVTSAGWSATLGRAVVMGYVRGAAPVERAWVLSGRYQLDIAGQVVGATIAARPPFQG